MGCPDENTIDAYVAGTLDETVHAPIAKHLSECAECRRLVSVLARGLDQKAVVHGGTIVQGSAGTDHDSGDTLFSPANTGAPFFPQFAPSDLIGERYRIVRFIAEGGMGAVYEAEDIELAARVALKTVRPEIAAQPRVLDRFKREIFLSRKVTHPNVCRIFDMGFHQSPSQERIAFLTMEFLDGENLAIRIERDGKMNPVEALPLIEQMASALQAAHEAGVVHRDFKSPNVVLVSAPSGVRAVVTDFGLARSASDEGLAASTTGQAGLVGSPAYMAPEQVAGKEISAAADIYALGVVIYEMMTGAWPFLAETPALTAIKRLQERAPSPRLLVPTLDPQWEKVILRCLERNPADRFAAVTEVSQALQAGASAPRGESQRIDTLIGRSIGNYIVKKRISEGATAAVYLAEHPQIDRRIAVKVLHPKLSSNREIVERFFTEARAISAIHHRHIVEALDFGELSDGTVYFAMEWLEGRSLDALISSESPLSVDRCIQILREAGEALTAAHALGIVHRDLKPANIFLSTRQGDRESVKVLDFGIAKLTDTRLRGGYETAAGAIFGTPAYMSPEQCRGAHADVDARSDIYALGVITYEILTAKLPFPQERLADLLLAHMNESPKAPSALNPAVSNAVDEVILRALAKDRDDRFSDVRAFVRAFEESARPIKTGRTWRIGAAVTAMAVAVLFYSFNRPRSGPLPPVTPRASTLAAVTPAASPLPTATVEIRVLPNSAVLLVDGAEVRNPYRSTATAGNLPHRVEARAPGYLSETQTILFDLDRTVEIELKPELDLRAEKSLPPTSKRLSTPTGRKRDRALLTDYPE